MIGIVRDIKASKDYWEDHATGLFAPNRISIFAASDNGYEMICLIWFDGTEEPELWVYDCNGESRYKDLAANVKHWHGAAADSWFAHLAFEIPGEEVCNEWLEPVTDKMYDQL